MSAIIAQSTTPQTKNELRTPLSALEITGAAAGKIA